MFGVKHKSFSLSAIFAAALFCNIAHSDPAYAGPDAPKRGESTPQAMLIIDAKTGDIYHQHNPHKLWTTASLNKAMTLHLLFEHMKANKLDETASMTMSRKAEDYLKGWNASKLYANAGEKISYDLAARATIAKSAGDISFAIAEHVSGSHQAFVNLMNETAQSWGMYDTRFTDASGFSKRPRRGKPRDYSKSTACDMAVMMQNIISANPELYTKYFSATEYEHRGTVQKPARLFTNYYEHAEGQKSGYLNVSRNNLVASATIGDVRLIGVSLGTHWRPDSNRLMAEGF